MINQAQPGDSRASAVGVTASIVALNWAIFGLMLVLLNDSADWQATVGVLMLAQAFTGWIAWRRFRVIKAAIFPDFLSFVLMYQFGTKLLTMTGLILRSTGEDLGSVSRDLKLMESVSVIYQFQAELVFLLATVVFTFVWRLQEKKGIPAVWVEPAANAAWWAYAIGLVGYLGLTATGGGAALGMVQELLRLFAIGALAALLAGSSVYALGNARGWMPLVALGPLLLLALKSGMKAEVALVFFPLFIPILRRLTATRLSFIAGFLVFALLFIFPFAETWRNENWRAGASAKQQATIQEVADKVADSWARDGVLETAYSSSAKWLSRGSSAEQGGLVMSLAERDGFIGPILIEGLATIFVPRFLWPDKPTYAPGAWFTWYLGNAESPEEATTSTAMMLATELYWMFGVAGVVVGMALISFWYFRVWNFLIAKSRVNLIATLALFALLARSAGMEELHTIYAISSPIILLVYVLLFSAIINFLTAWHRSKFSSE